MLEQDHGECEHHSRSINFTCLEDECNKCCQGAHQGVVIEVHCGVHQVQGIHLLIWIEDAVSLPVSLRLCLSPRICKTSAPDWTEANIHNSLEEDSAVVRLNFDELPQSEHT